MIHTTKQIKRWLCYMVVHFKPRKPSPFLGPKNSFNLDIDKDIRLKLSHINHIRKIKPSKFKIVQFRVHMRISRTCASTKQGLSSFHAREF